MIQPTIGRIVWYRPSEYDRTMLTIYDDQPLSATVAYVHSDTMVNLTVSGHNGSPYGRTSVRLLQDGDTPMPGTAYCEWMPFQKGQAAKTEALERRVGAGNDTNAGATS